MTDDQQPANPVATLNQRLDVNFALQAAGLGVWEVDPLTNLVNWDDRCKELFGFAKDNQLPYEQAIQYIHPEDVDRVNQAVQRAMNPQSDGQYDVTYRTTGADDGKLRWVRFHGRGYFTPTGELHRFAGVAQEVTEQVLARQQLAEVETKLRTIITNLPSATVVFRGRNLVVETPSQYFIDIIDRGPDVTGKPLGELMPELESQAFLKILDEVYTSGQPFRIFGAPVTIRQEDGSTTHDFFDLIYTPLFDGQGQVYAILSVATNVTEVVNAQQKIQESEARYRRLTEELDLQVQERTQELAAANQELAANNEELVASTQEAIASNQHLEESNLHLIRSNENLEQFAYIASHDLQEPLRKIQQFGDLLKTRYAGSTGDELLYLDRMQTAAVRMSLLIKDLLTFSRISTSQAVVKPVPLGNVITQVVEDLSVVIEESGAQIRVDMLPTVQGDQSQLSQLFQNLVSNAVKFSRWPTSGEMVTPQIRVRSSLVLRNELPTLLQSPRYAEAYHRIDVADNGIGFDAKYLDRIFQVFQRLHGKNEFAGTGIGLAVVQKVVTNHGGAITASSRPGEGATFSIYLPE